MSGHGTDGGQGPAILGRAVRRLSRHCLRLVAAVLVVSGLFLVVPEEEAGRVFGIAGALLMVVLLLVATARQRVRIAAQWPCSQKTIHISTTGVAWSQRVRAALGSDDSTVWRCTSLLGFETRQSFTGPASVWLSPTGRRGLVAWSPSKVRFLSEPRQRS